MWLYFPLSGKEVKIGVAEELLGLVNIPDRIHLDIFVP